MRSTSKRIAALALAAVLFPVAMRVQAAPPVPDLHSRWYYRIGGADSVMGALNRGARTASISGSADLRLGLNCQGFNPVAGLSTAINRVVDNLEAVVGNALSSAVSALPGLIIQRANPSLYEAMQEVLSYANATVSLATKSCEQMQSDSAQGKNPFDKWLTLKRTYTWKDQAGQSQTSTSTTDVVTAQEVVDETGDKEGVPWVDGQKAGGGSQPPIRLVSDVVKTGYNIEQNQTGGLLGNHDGDASTLVGKTWQNPQAAADFAVAVLGDMEIASGSSPKSTAGHGLLPQIEKDRDAITAKLADLVKGNTQPTPDNLAQASSVHTVINREVLDAIRKLPAGEQAIAVGKLASEAATAANVEKALMLRRLLLAGSGEPHVYAAGVGEDIQRLAEVLNREVDQLLFEARVRKELLSGTSAALLDMGREEDARAVPAYRQGDAKPVTNGAAPR